MGKKINFTLIELIIVVLILGLTIFLLLPMIRPAREKTKCGSSCTSNLKQIGLAVRMYSQEYKEEFPPLPGRSGFEMLRSGGYLENVKMYTCPSTTDTITDNYDLRSSSVSYKYACGMNESTSVDSGLAIDRASNHTKYGNILFVDGHVAGFAGATWSVGNIGSSYFSW